MDERPEPPTAEQLAADDVADGARPAAAARRQPAKRAAAKKAAPKKAAQRKRPAAGDDTQQLRPVRSSPRPPRETGAIGNDPRVVRNAIGLPVVYVSDETDPYLEHSLRALRHPTMMSARVPIVEGEPAVAAPGSILAAAGRPWAPRGPSPAERLADAKRWMWLKIAAMVGWAVITAGVLFVAYEEAGLGGIVIVAYAGMWVGIAGVWLVVGDALNVQRLREKAEDAEERARVIDAR